MNINEQIVINKFGQDLLSIHEILNMFQSKDKEHKKKFLTDLAFLIVQSKPTETDIDNAIELGKLKPTFTPCVKIRKGIKGHILQELIDLPDNETEKVLVLFLSLYKIAYQRLLLKEKDSPTKWWYQDLSNDEFIDRIKTLSDLKLIIRKLYNVSGIETGAIISAFIPFPINLYEKNIVERQLELHAFNNLYPKTGLNLFKEIHDDTASLTVIKDINSLPYDETKISIY
jgi:hypothetical protein